MDNKSNYMKYRGKCKEFCEQLIKANPSFTMVRGHYYEPMWDRDEQHWWCVDEQGVIHDPTAKQFPSGGIAQYYTEFNGSIDCEECGTSILEADIIMQGRYPVCSELCALKLVGLA